MELLKKSFSSNQVFQGSNPYPGCVQKELRFFLLHMGEANLDLNSKTQVISPILSTVSNVSS